MIVDASALIAILRGEPEAAAFSRALEAAPARMSVANWFEANMVAQRYFPSGQDRIDDLIALADVEVVPVTVQQGLLARDAHRRYGRGSGSRARLNFGDCFAYALATDTGRPLLFKGDDFIHTDVRPALT